MNRFSVITLLLFAACTPLAQTSTTGTESGKILALEDRTYESQIKTVRLFAPSGDLSSELLPAVTKIGNWNLVLEFDDLQDQREFYYARIIHCRHDWSPSNLADLDFMPEFNEYPINTFEYSINTHLPYVHYQLRLPAVKLPGNYVVAVYRGSNRDDVILTRRFMVFDPRVSIAREGNLVGAGAVARMNQQINFLVTYKNFPMTNPLENVFVTIRQNQRWDNAAAGVRPSFLRDDQSELEYRFFDDSKMFKGGNEFRFFDLRSLNHPGQNVGSVNKTTQPYHVYLATDQPRTQSAYAQYLDLNGSYILQNYDYPSIQASQYAQVHFALESKPLPGDVYLTSAFTQWSNDESNRLQYDSARGIYHIDYLLKQGYYNYQYRLKSATLPPSYLEGTHFETENLYEIFVYYRSFQPQADLLIGYYVIRENAR